MVILVTAGPTREAIDPVRYLSNRSSGRMGYAIAEAAAEAGHEVVLVSGPASVTLESVAGRADDSPAARIRIIDVISAEEMYLAVEKEIGRVDAAVMAAAVADYRPAAAAGQKIKKREGGMTMELERTRDILGSARGVMGFGGVLVGFAAETEALEENARIKLEGKGCDLVVANDVGRSDIGFDVEDNEVLLLFAGGGSEVLAKGSKREIGVMLIQRIERLAKERASSV